MSKETVSRKPRLKAHGRMVLARRYLKRDRNNRVVETPARMFARVAGFVAKAEALYDSLQAAENMASRFYDLMASLDFLPNSPTLINAGREIGQLSACFVLPVEDSIASIFNAVRDTALIHKSGGGTGFSFSRIRPARDLVKSTLGVSSGPLSFMNVFDLTTETIKQGGVRRGANMGILSVHHPDILEFISAKAKKTHLLANFNLSVSATDLFMEKVKNGGSIELINPHDQTVWGVLPAEKIMDQLVQSAWESGDPGLIFIDRVNADNPLPGLGPIEATNPCGEQPLLPYESCTLGSINLSRFVKGKKVDYARLGRVVDLAVRFLDDVIDVNRLPLKEIEEMTGKTRKIGLGVMGLADMLLRLGVPYDSPESLEICRRLMSRIHERALTASSELAVRRGNFPAHAQSLYAGKKTPMRNATTTTIAPTGTLSIIAGCSSGIEPLFALAYRRRVLGQRELIEVNPFFKSAAKKEGLWNQDLADDLAVRGSIGHRTDFPEEMKRLFVTAHDIDPEWHLEIQAAFQAYTDNAVSKTVNLPRSASRETVRAIFMKAWDLGLKGVTVYRDQSKADQVLSFGNAGLHCPTGTEPENGGPCPECGAALKPEEGCWFCRHCGYSRCY